jgi:hypothetical protein
MKSSLALLVTFFAVVAAATASGAGGNGSPFSPGLDWGYNGVLAERAGLRYVTLSTENATIVAAIRTRSGSIVRMRYLRGHFGVPLVAYDGTTAGLSGDGKRLVLGSYGPPPGTSGITNFAVLDTKSLRLRKLVRLDGSWSFDAVAPDGSTLYLTQHVRAGTNPVYRVRTFDVRTGLLRGALVDRLEGEGDMGGEPATRAASSDGRWAYTLYARRAHEPFIHALDTVKREAFCIGLPLAVGYDGQRALRLKLREHSELLTVRHQGRVVATVDTDSWDVEDRKG